MKNLSLHSKVSVLTLMALLGTPATAQDTSSELGRLFFTPERRQILDRQRQLQLQEKQDVSEDPLLTINGVVTRSSGKRTVWINGVSQNENEIQSDVILTPNRKYPGKIVVQTSDAPLTSAKVGDTVNRNSGENIDLLGEGRISIKSHGAK
ncbi:MAG: hypothetical protein WCK63_14110 [Betaproteobacteria bacterium]